MARNGPSETFTIRAAGQKAPSRNPKSGQIPDSGALALLSSLARPATVIGRKWIEMLLRHAPPVNRKYPVLIFDNKCVSGQVAKEDKRARSAFEAAVQ